MADSKHATLTETQEINTKTRLKTQNGNTNDNTDNRKITITRQTESYGAQRKNFISKPRINIKTFGTEAQNKHKDDQESQTREKLNIPKNPQKSGNIT